MASPQAEPSPRAYPHRRTCIVGRSRKFLMVELRTVTERDILALRGPRNPVDPSRPYLWFTEHERTADGRIEDVTAIFLTNKECPFRCLFCDLWKNTTEERVPPGAVAGQGGGGLAGAARAPHVKL